MPRLLETVPIDPSVAPYPLKTDGRLEIVFIGVGSMLAERPLRQTNFLICKGDTHIMVDFGRTAPEALFDATGVKMQDIRVMLPTHSHSDHVNGLSEYYTASRYFWQPFLKKPKPITILTEGYRPILWDSTLRGGLEHNEEENGRRLSFKDFTDFVTPTWKKFEPREVVVVDFGGIDIEMFRTKHIPDSASGWEDSFVSYGLFVDNHVFLSVDTRFDRGLLQMYERQASTMFHDVQFFPKGVHAPLEDFRYLPTFVKEKLFFMHYSNNYTDQHISEFAGWAEQGVRYIFG